MLEKFMMLISIIFINTILFRLKTHQQISLINLVPKHPISQKVLLQLVKEQSYKTTFLQVN